MKQNLEISQQQPLDYTVKDATDVTEKLHDDINLVAHSMAIHDQLLLQLIDEIDHLKITNAQLYIRLLHLERKEKNT